MEELFYTIKEVSERLGVSYRTLHYYEQKFELEINRDGSGNRNYSEYDVELLEKIVDLKTKGLKLDAIKELLKEKGILKPNENNVVVVDEKSLDIKDFLISEIKSTIVQELKHHYQETNNKLDDLSKENELLHEEIRNLQRQSENHYNKIDQKLTSWRENQQPWYKACFNKLFNK
ncbi:MAG: MerR family transcriptional regulator [Peptostreptococcaceae bacterium]|jgi:DNA-binding transcriptional MerR regulator|nr:MerR family transcriptional regulator [Peptostreptococcaceae bacterium]